MTARVVMDIIQCTQGYTVRIDLVFYQSCESETSVDSEMSGWKNSMGLPYGSPRMICLPPPVVMISLQNLAGE
jgi:hypothetical protein